jgi:hypothetical protein
MRFECFIAVTIWVEFFWVVIPTFRPEEWGSKALRNVGILSQLYTASLQKYLDTNWQFKQAVTVNMQKEHEKFCWFFEFMKPVCNFNSLTVKFSDIR